MSLATKFSMHGMNEMKTLDKEGGEKMKRVIIGFIGVLVKVGILAASAMAVPVTDFDVVSLGSLVLGPTTDAFDVALPPPATMGNLLSNVYLDSVSGVYTYVFDVTPSIDNISEVNTAFNVLGFNGTAGYSSSDATTVGTQFTIDLDADGERLTTTHLQVVLSILVKRLHFSFSRLLDQRQVSIT